MCLVTLLAVACATAPAPQPTGDADQQAELEVTEYLGAVFRERYALAQLKRRSFGWDLNAELDRVRAAARNHATPEAFRRSLYLFFHSVRDLHTHMAFEDTRSVWLGLHVKRVDGTYRVAWVDRGVLPREAFPAEPGDEVISLDGAPYDTAVTQARQATQWRSTEGFEQVMAERLTVVRAASEWGTIPEPGALVRMRVRHSGAELDLRLPWIDLNVRPPATPCTFWGRTPASYVPELGKVVWTGPGRIFPAYAFESGGSVYGYLRLHTYDVPPAQQLEGARELRDAVDALLKIGVRGVVLDQIGNGGGSFQYVLSSLGRLFPKPLLAPRFQYLRGDHGFVVGFGGRKELDAYVAKLEAPRTDDEAARLMQATPLYAGPLNYLPREIGSLQRLTSLLRFFLERPGEPGLTPPHGELFETFTPDTARGPPFEGPILVLVDEVTLSAPEFGAATLADNGRATLFGKPTAGAGGNQRWIARDSVCPPNVARDERVLSECVPRGVSGAMKRLGILGFGYTATLGVRVNGDGSIGDVIENRGVTPQIEYQVSERDLREGFAPLRQRIVRELARRK
jgi:C-terminal processing protease CtpA/Prc